MFLAELRKKLSDRLPLLIFTFICGFALSILVLFMYVTHRNIAEAIQGSSVNEARLIAARLEATLHWIEASNGLFAEGLFDQALADPVTQDGPDPINEQLGILAAYYPEIIGFHFMDAAGRILRSNDPDFNLRKFTGLEQCRTPGQDPQAGTFYSDPLYDADSGSLVMLVCCTVMIDDVARGQIGATIDLGYYEMLFSGLELGQAGIASIRRSDTSRLVVRWPRIVARLNNAAPDIPPQLLIEQGHGAGVVSYVGQTDAVQRLFAFQRVQGYPFYVLVGRAINEQYGQWRIISVVVTALTVLILAFIGFLLLRMRHQRDRLLKREAEYRAIVENQSDAVCRWLPDGSLTFANQKFAGLMPRHNGSSPSGSGLVGRKWLECLVEDDQAAAAQAILELSTTLKPVTHEFRVLDADGSRRIFDWISVPLFDAQGGYREVQSVGRDVTERQRLQERLRLSLREKEVMLRELYHRTRNNMQVISSIINMQAQQYESPAIVDILGNIDQRIACMALVHEMLYNADDLVTINLLEYARQLAATILSVHGMDDGRISLDVGGDGVMVMLDEAAPLGLVVNELVTNSCKHAFPDGRRGAIHLQLCSDGPGTLRLDYADDGVGSAICIDPSQSGGLGRLLIWSLVEHQLGGHIAVRTGAGLEYSIQVSLGAYQKRL